MRKMVWAVALAGFVGAGVAGIASAKPTCDQILAEMEKAGGSLSADEVAKKMGTTPEQVRECMAATKGGAAPMPPTGGAK